MATIEELLKSMLTLPTEGKKGNFVGLENNKETWKRIQNGTWADNMSFSDDNEKEAFLRDFIDNNPYSNI